MVGHILTRTSMKGITKIVKFSFITLKYILFEGVFFPFLHKLGPIKPQN